MKKIVTMCAVLVVLSLGSFIAYDYSNQNAGDRELLLANAEALASGEGSSTSWTCWSQSKSSSGGFWRCGNPCTWVDGQTGTGSSSMCYK